MFCQRSELTLNYCPSPAPHPHPRSSMEGVMAMNNVEWTPENIRTAEKACKEAQQMVIIKTIDVSVPGDTAASGSGRQGYGMALGEARNREE